MSSYRFKNQRKYRRRRALLGTISVLGVIAIIMAGYLLLNNQPVTGANNAGNSTGAPSSQTSSTASNTASPSTAGDSSAANNTGGQSSDSTGKTGNQNENPDIVATKEHGNLPKVGTINKTGDMAALKKIITDFTKPLKGRYGVTFIDLATGDMVNVNDQVQYIAASTSKLPINVYVFKQIEAGKVSLDDMLVYKQEDLEYGTGIIQQSPFGTQYTVRETSKLSIRKSDNCGVNMLIRLGGIENIRKYMMGLGGKVLYDKRHRSCPYDMALIAQDLYKLYLNNEAVYGELIYNLENTDWHDRIDAKLPKSVKVAHKIGNQTRTANDVGIVFASHPYVLSIMTEEVDPGVAYGNIANLSKKIYDFEEAYAAKTSVQTK